MAVEIEAGIGAEIAVPARDIAGDLQGVDVGLLQPEAALQAPFSQRGLKLAIGGVDLLLVAEVIGDVGIVVELAGRGIDFVAAVVEGVVVVFKIVAELEAAIAGHGQHIVGAELRRH